MKRGNVTTNYSGIQRFVREFFEKLILKKKGKILDMHYLPKLNQDIMASNKI